MKITSKEQFNELSQAGKLGNYLRTWNSLKELREANYIGWLTIQSRAKQSPHFIPCVTSRFVHPSPGYMTVERAVVELLEDGAPLEQMYFRQIPHPLSNRPIQFEAMLGPQWRGDGAGVTLCYELNSTKALRGIRERGHHCHGLNAQMLLRQRLTPASYDMLQDIWEQYPTAVIEFTEFSQPCGEFNQNGIVWEVRNF